MDIKVLEMLVNEGLSRQRIAERLGIKRSLVSKRMRQHGLKSRFVLRTTPEQRQRMSAAKRKWNLENPERLRQLMIERAKNLSVPCERLKTWLRTREIPFIEEFEPLRHLGRYYSIDIAFPDRKIGIEVNGNQHYEKDGRLKERYQKRHDDIEADGWTLYEIHYPICFKEDAIDEMVRLILSSPTRVEFDYGQYRPAKKKTPTRKYPKGDNSWRKLPRPKARKVSRPSKENLKMLIWSKPVVLVAADFGLTGSAIRRWCKEMGIQTPPCRYWPRRKAGWTHEEALEPIKQTTPKRIVTTDTLARIIHLRKLKTKWTVIARDVGFDRHTVKNAYDKWCDQRKSNPHEGVSPSTSAG